MEFRRKNSKAKNFKIHKKPLTLNGRLLGRKKVQKGTATSAKHTKFPLFMCYQIKKKRKLKSTVKNPDLLSDENYFTHFYFEEGSYKTNYPLDLLFIRCFN